MPALNSFLRDLVLAWAWLVPLGVHRRTLSRTEDWPRVSAHDEVGVFYFVDVGAWDALIHSIKSISLLRANPTRPTRLHRHIKLALLIRARPRRVLADLR